MVRPPASQMANGDYITEISQDAIKQTAPSINPIQRMANQSPQVMQLQSIQQAANQHVLRQQAKQQTLKSDQVQMDSIPEISLSPLELGQLQGRLSGLGKASNRPIPDALESGNARIKGDKIQMKGPDLNGQEGVGEIGNKLEQEGAKDFTLEVNQDQFEIQARYNPYLRILRGEVRGKSKKWVRGYRKVNTVTYNYYDIGDEYDGEISNMEVSGSDSSSSSSSSDSSSEAPKVKRKRNQRNITPAKLRRGSAASGTSSSSSSSSKPVRKKNKDSTWTGFGEQVDTQIPQIQTENGEVSFHRGVSTLIPQPIYTLEPVEQEAPPSNYPEKFNTKAKRAGVVRARRLSVSSTKPRKVDLFGFRKYKGKKGGDSIAVKRKKLAAKKKVPMGGGQQKGFYPINSEKKRTKHPTRSRAINVKAANYRNMRVTQMLSEISKLYMAYLKKHCPVEIQMTAGFTGKKIILFVSANQKTIQSLILQSKPMDVLMAGLESETEEVQVIASKLLFSTETKAAREKELEGDPHEEDLKHELDHAFNILEQWKKGDFWVIRRKEGDNKGRHAEQTNTVVAYAYSEGLFEEEDDSSDDERTKLAVRPTKSKGKKKKNKGTAFLRLETAGSKIRCMSCNGELDMNLRCACPPGGSSSSSSEEEDSDAISNRPPLASGMLFSAQVSEHGLSNNVLGRLKSGSAYTASGDKDVHMPRASSPVPWPEDLKDSPPPRRRKKSSLKKVAGKQSVVRARKQKAKKKKRNRKKNSKWT